MLRILILSLLLMVTIIGAADEDTPTRYTTSIGPNPKIDVWNSNRITQITFSNGDKVHPEVIILLCDRDSRTLFFRYHISRQGKYITSADFFTLQRYPAGITSMRYPYYPPARVIYDSGMGLSKDRFSTIIGDLLATGEWGFVFTLEELTDDDGARTKAWSTIYPSSVVKRDLANKDISGCLYTDTRIMLPLL